MSRSSRPLKRVNAWGTWKEELSRRNEDQLYLALSSAHMGTWDWHPLDHTMHLDEPMHALFGLMPSGQVSFSSMFTNGHVFG
jgi:hypothetical protein